MITGPSRQRGLSLIGWVVVLIILAVFGTAARLQVMDVGLNRSFKEKITFVRNPKPHRSDISGISVL